MPLFKRSQEIKQQPSTFIHKEWHLIFAYKSKSALQNRDFTQISTWGELCDSMIKKEGRDKFKEKYTTEMLRAYDAGFLYIIPFSPSSVLETTPPQPSPLNFVDREICHSKGFLVCHGVSRSDPERKLELQEFFRMFGEERSPQPDPPLEYPMPVFFVQSRFTDFNSTILHYAILELPDENSSNTFTNALSQMEEKEARDYANSYMENYPRLRSESGSPAGTYELEGSQIRYSRKMSPASAGDLELQYTMRWRSQKLSFYVNESIKGFRVDEQTLKNVIFGPFIDNPVYWKAMTLYRMSKRRPFA